MVENAYKYLEWFEELNFYNTVVSLKSTSLEETRIANEKFKTSITLHIGVTKLVLLFLQHDLLGIR